MTAQVVHLPSPSPSWGEPLQPPRDRALRRRVVAGLLVSALVLFGVGGWAAVAKLSGAVIASGLIVIDSNIKKVQHPTGGVVGELRVQNGTSVRAGEVVVRLDDTQTRAGLGIVVAQLAALSGRKARLAAEAMDQEVIHFPDLPRDFGALGQEAMDGERRLFQARRKQREAQKAQLRSRIGQLGREIEGLRAQQAAKGDELALIDIESSRVQHLHDQDLVPETRLLAIRRDRTRIAGEHGTLTAQIARAEGQISEIELQILNVDQTVQSEAQAELRDIESRIAELMERRIAAEDQLKRVDIKAPINGIVHELAIYTVGGVISPAETLMLIVPSGDRLTVEVRLSQTDIDQVAIGQPTRLRFAAFNHRTTPELTGAVSRVAADLSRDPQSGQTFYVARVRVDDSALEKLDGLKLVPGMPVEAFIETDERTVLSYIVKPFSDQLMRAMREE